MDIKEYRQAVLDFNTSVIDWSCCQVDFNKLLGRGSVMEVYEGTFTINGTTKKAAFKFPLPTRHPIQMRALWRTMAHETKLVYRHDQNRSLAPQIYGVTFKENRDPALVVELAFATLDDYLWQRKEDMDSLGWDVKLKLCKDIADCIEILHKANVVHGDIKGSNILLFHNGEMDGDRNLVAKLSDFGYNSSHKTSADVRGGGLGYTPPFVPPECTSSGLKLNPEFDQYQQSKKRDYYSYGVLVWQIAKDGEIPFADMSDHGEQAKLTPDPTTLLETLPNECNKVMWGTVFSACKYNPNHRQIGCLPKLIAYDSIFGDFPKVLPGHLLRFESLARVLQLVHDPAFYMYMHIENWTEYEATLFRRMLNRFFREELAFSDDVPVSDRFKVSFANKEAMPGRLYQLLMALTYQYGTGLARPQPHKATLIYAKYFKNTFGRPPCGTLTNFYCTIQSVWCFEYALSHLHGIGTKKNIKEGRQIFNKGIEYISGLYPDYPNLQSMKRNFSEAIRDAELTEAMEVERKIWDILIFESKTPLEV